MLNNSYYSYFFVEKNPTFSYFSVKKAPTFFLLFGEWLLEGLNPSISKGVIERKRIGDGRTDRPTRQSESSIAPPHFVVGV